MKKKILALFLALCFICSQGGIVTLAAEVAKATSSVNTGTLGDNGGFSWTYDSSTRILRVTGEDTGIGESIQKQIGITAPRIIFEDCTFKGSMARLFYGYTGLGSVQFINCDTSNVTDMSYMFYGCRTALTSIDLSGLDTSSVTDMSYMFYGCEILGFYDGKINLNSFDTSSVTNMS